MLSISSTYIVSFTLHNNPMIPMPFPPSKEKIWEAKQLTLCTACRPAWDHVWGPQSQPGHSSRPVPVQCLLKAALKWAAVASQHSTEGLPSLRDWSFIHPIVGSAALPAALPRGMRP